MIEMAHIFDHDRMRLEMRTYDTRLPASKLVIGVAPVRVNNE